VPADERKQVGPDPAKPGKHDTGRGIILRIMRGGTPVPKPDQHPVDSLMLRLVGHRTSPDRHRGWCTSGPTGAECLAVPRRGHHVGDHGFPGFSNGFTAKVTMFTTIQGLGCGRNGRLAGMCADEEGGALSRMRQTARGGRYDLTVGTLQRLATASACGEQE
jgi:hypothetical protein